MCEKMLTFFRCKGMFALVVHVLQLTKRELYCLSRYKVLYFYTYSKISWLRFSASLN